MRDQRYEPDLLFVYGTLRPGHAPASVASYVGGCGHVGPGSIAGRLYDLRNYPGAIVDAAGEGQVYGEVLALPDWSTLHRLDAYEGYHPEGPQDSLFVRTECDVALDDGRTVRAWVYVYNRDVSGARPVPGGRYHPTPAMRRPVIGITLDHRDPGSDGGGAYLLPFDYASSIEAAGGLPFAIPYRTHPALIPQYVDLVDGVLFTGGNDLDPAAYGEAYHPKAVPIDPDRQHFELALLAEVERRRTPVLGVCLGSQVMNVHRGGSLVQFLPDQARDGALEHRKLGDDGRRHAVRIEPGTVLSEAIGKPQIVANTRHKQAVATLGRGLRANAYAPDGVIEGIEDPRRRFCIGVQWHPEYGISEADHRLFAAFIDAARR